jgi:hypothetical protein
MLTKLVVTVASTMSTAAAVPAPAAASIVPGSALPACRARRQPSGMSHRAVSARPAKTASALVRAFAVKRE